MMYVMNGWKIAPHCWRGYWRFRIDRMPAWTSYSFLGFVVFVMKGD